MLVGVAFLLPLLQNIGILHHKKAKLPKHLQQSVHISRIHRPWHAYLHHHVVMTSVKEERLFHYVNTKSPFKFSVLIL